MNRVILIGNLGKDPELKKLPTSGMSVVNFTLCTNEQWTGKDGKENKRSEWHACVLYGPGAQTLAQNAAKGDCVSLEGRLQTRSWEKNGVKHYKTEVIVSEWKLMDKPVKSNTSQQDVKDFTQIAQRIADGNEADWSIDDLPF